MSVWDTYPESYREKEVQAVTRAVRAGECVSVIGLSGAGKSNLIGFLAHRSPLAEKALLVDCNRLAQPTPDAFFRLVRQGLGDSAESSDDLRALEAAIDRRLAVNPPSPSSGWGRAGEGVCLLLDRFDALPAAALPLIASNLRALRDAHKYQLTYITATRRPLDPHSELAELFYAHTIWLGPLSESDARWNVNRYAERIGATWDANTAEALIRLTWGYPSLLRAACEAYADGCPLELAALCQHPAIQRRVDEFWASGDPAAQPTEADVCASGLASHPLLGEALPAAQPIPTVSTDDSQLTAKEHLLLEHFRSHPNQVCGKDDLIRAVWPEDRIFERGVRDDSLAQLIRRLRQKIEADASSPQHILTVPGRGYRFVA